MEFIKKYISIFILALSLVALGAGLMRGEARTVLNKAITVCLECIGIG